MRSTSELLAVCDGLIAMLDKALCEATPPARADALIAAGKWTQHELSGAGSVSALRSRNDEHT